jgi:Protein O-mannosyl-transferase TMEM260-like
MVTRRHLAIIVPPILVGIAAFVAVRGTMLPGVDFWDTGELQTVGPLMGTAHPTGFPTYVLLAWFANIVLGPFGEPALRMNILSGLCVAIAAGVTVDLARVLTRSIPLGVMAGLGMAFTEGVWAIGTHAEAHSLHLALVAILLRLLVAWEDASPGPRADRWLVAAAVVYGLAMGNHSLVLLLAPGIALFVFAVEPRIWRRPRFVLACGLAMFATAAVVFLELPLRAGPFRAPLVYGRPETWDGFWYIVLAEQFRGSLIAPFSDLGDKFGVLVSRTVAAFGPLAALIPVGLVATAILRPRYALLTGVPLAITCFFAASYDNADIGRYYLVPALIAWTWLAMLASAVATAIRAEGGEIWPEEPETLDAPAVRRTGRRAALRPGTLVALALGVLLLVPTILSLDARGARVDRSGDLMARSWVDHTMKTLAPGAVVVSWWSYSTPLWYAQHVEGQRPDVTIIDDRTRLDEDLGDIYDVIDANLPNRPVYVIRADPLEVAGLAERYALEPIDGPDARFLTRVLGPKGGGG